MQIRSHSGVSSISGGVMTRATSRSIARSAACDIGLPDEKKTIRGRAAMN